jgi:hypothetical protein
MNVTRTLWNVEMGYNWDVIAKLFGFENANKLKEYIQDNQTMEIPVRFFTVDTRFDIDKLFKMLTSTAYDFFTLYKFFNKLNPNTRLYTEIFVIKPKRYILDYGPKSDVFCNSQRLMHYYIERFPDTYLVFEKL